MRPLPLTLWALLTAQIDALDEKNQLPPSIPTAIRKMPPDPNAKFHPHYAAFDNTEQQLSLPAALLARSQSSSSSSNTTDTELSPPFALLNTSPNLSPLELLRRSLQSRQWSCPQGTNSCGSIGYPNSCCANTETCVKIEDTGLGPVGCCPRGTSCNGSVGACADGASPCASQVGGGCCIPGFVCAGVGCVQAPPPPPPVNTQSSSTPSPPPTSSTPSSLPSATTTTTNQDPNAPIRPTSSTPSPPGSEPTEPPPPATTSSIPSDFCPTGYYPCLASAGGGCCQTGRDCSVTNCPSPLSSATITNAGGGITVVVPGRAAPPVDSANKQCAGGWFECNADVGGGCCPSGYECASVSCLVGPGGNVNGAAETAGVAKILPGENKARGGHGMKGSGLLGLVVGVMGMVMV
ncbi:hypothetical protein QBC43DRAFT_308305 [Cladorrhinum sp. PSN259]|nr:hypothetical protein QBC43DRAFT_308305 [Cladorrhinum sp. PSN259]